MQLLTIIERLGYSVKKSAPGQVRVNPCMFVGGGSGTGLCQSLDNSERGLWDRSTSSLGCFWVGLWDRSLSILG